MTERPERSSTDHPNTSALTHTQMVDLIWARLSPRGSGSVKSRLIRFVSYDSETSTVVYADAELGRVTIAFANAPDDVKFGPSTTVSISPQSDPPGFVVARNSIVPARWRFASAYTMTFDRQETGCPMCGGSEVYVKGFASYRATRDGVPLTEPVMSRTSAVMCATCSTPLPHWQQTDESHKPTARPYRGF